VGGLVDYRSAVHHRAPAIAGAILGVATTAAYLVGVNRSYGYDAAATFANFVATPSLWDAFAIHSVLPPTIPIKSIAWNDQVLLSFLSHLTFSLTGSRAEAVYTSNFAVVSTPDQLAGCDAVVVVSWNVDLALRDLAAQKFPPATALGAYYPAVVLERLAP
jgi:hypothetical protein